jgi:LysR family pca operon transcriptional activator
MDRRLKFRHIQCFLEAAKSRRLMDVARSLNITQAAVSKTITEMEHIVGLKLLLRD